MRYIDKAVESIKLAYMSHAPIVWLVSPTLEAANDIAVAFAREHFGDIRVASIGHKEFAYKGLDSWGAGDPSNHMSPCIYFDWRPGLKADDESLKSIFEAFVGMHQSLEIEKSARLIIDEGRQAAYLHSMIILASTESPDMGWLNRYINVVYVGSLQDEEIESIIRNFLKRNGVAANDSFIEQLVVNFRGVSEREIGVVLLKCLVSEYFDHSDSERQNKILQEIRGLKRQMLDGFNGLKWIPIDKNATKASGLDAITKWFNDRKDIFSDPERKQKEGFDVPKGVLVTGIPGTGKSLMAKEAARILNLPLVAMDLGDLQEGVVGKSEEHMAAALRMVDTMAPCVLWIDEIEKAFSGADSSQSDGGVMRRMFGKFLTWMQEKQSFCFVFATSNDISKLPPELFRSERFDDKFYNFMPSVDECADIFVSCVKYHNGRYKKENGNAALLFDGVLETKDFWAAFLNNTAASKGKVELTPEGYWADGMMPVRKLFTGADISALVKLLKFDVLSNRRQGQKGPITKLELKQAEERVMDDFMPYGETNLNDIASCFITLTHNRFKSASSLKSSEAVVSFDDFKAESSTLDYSPRKFPGSPYNQTLYRCIVGSVNALAAKNKKRQ